MPIDAGLALLLRGGDKVSDQAGGGRPVVGTAARPVDWGGGEKARPAPVETAVGGRYLVAAVARIADRGGARG